MSILTKIGELRNQHRINKLKKQSEEILTAFTTMKHAMEQNDAATASKAQRSIEKATRKLTPQSTFVPFKPYKSRLDDKDRTLLYNGMFINRYNLADIYHAYTKETYLKISIDKYIEGVIKRGYHIQSKTPEVIKYLNKRLKEIEIVSGMGLKDMIRGLLFSLILYGNSFLVKIRNRKRSTGRVHQWRGRKVNPISGLAIADPRRVIIYLDGRNQEKYAISPYKTQPSRPGATSDLQKLYEYVKNFPSMFMGWFGSFGRSNLMGLDQSKSKTFDSSDVEHIRYHPTPGEKWAMPPFWTTLDDINMLRSIETAVDLLIYQFGSVLIHVKVSNPIQNSINNMIKRPPDGATIQAVRQTINEMESNGFIVTGDHVEMKVLDVAQNVLELQDYLHYFKERVFSGLWISSVTTGESSNGVARSVADTVVDEKTSKIIELQSIIKNVIDNLFYELLLEAGLSHEEILDKNIYPELVFDDVDVALEMKKRDTVLRLWESGLLTETEARLMMNMDSIEDDEREFTYPRLVKGFLIEKEAEAKAQLASMNTKDLDKKSGANNKAANNIIPENQTGKKFNSKKPVNK